MKSETITWSSNPGRGRKDKQNKSCRTSEREERCRKEKRGVGKRERDVGKRDIWERVVRRKGGGEVKMLGGKWWREREKENGQEWKK